MLYAAYGISIDSEIKLPLPAVPEGEAKPDIVVVRGEVPTHLQQAAARAPAFQAKPGHFLFSIPTIGRILVRDGRQVTVEPVPGVGEESLGLHISQSIMGALLHQRGSLPLHASAVIAKDSCVAFLGNSGDGKSTLAAALRQRGYPSFCDDICVVKAASGVPTIFPGPGRIKIWADAAEALGLDTRHAPRAHPEGERYSFAEDLPFPDRPTPLRRLYILQRAIRDEESFEPLRGLDAVERLIDYTYRVQYVEPLGKTASYFQTYARLAGSVEVFTWKRCWGFEGLNASLDRLEEHLGNP